MCTIAASHSDIDTLSEIICWRCVSSSTLHCMHSIDAAFCHRCHMFCGLYVWWSHGYAVQNRLNHNCTSCDVVHYWSTTGLIREGSFASYLSQCSDLCWSIKEDCSVGNVSSALCCMPCPVVSCRELKERITPEMIELIKQQRLNYLVNGTRFSVKLGRRSGLLFTTSGICLIRLICWELLYDTVWPAVTYNNAYMIQC